MPSLLPSALRAATGLPAALLLGGCLSMSAPPPELASLSLTKVNSARVYLWNVRLKKEHGRLFLYGQVFRQHPVADEDTSRTHLTITLFDSRGEPLRERPAEFEPRRIPHGYRVPGHSVLSVPLDMLPEHTSCIQVRAYDDPVPIPALSDH
jgi:hypothetical protein